MMLLRSTPAAPFDQAHTQHVGQHGQPRGVHMRRAETCPLSLWRANALAPGSFVHVMCAQLTDMPRVCSSLSLLGASWSPLTQEVVLGQRRSLTSSAHAIRAIYNSEHSCRGREGEGGVHNHGQACRSMPGLTNACVQAWPSLCTSTQPSMHTYGQGRCGCQPKSCATAVATGSGVAKSLHAAWALPWCPAAVRTSCCWQGFSCQNNATS